MERLDNYSIALCLYFLKGNTLSIDCSTPDIMDLKEDLFHYFDVIRYSIGAKPKLFNITLFNTSCSISVSNRLDELRQCLTDYVDDLTKNKLESSVNVLAWKQEYNKFIAKVKSSGYNLQSYNATLEDMHVILYGVISDIFALKRIDIIPNDNFEPFGTRTIDNDVDCADGSGLYKQLQMICTIDIESYINKQSKDNQEKTLNISGKTEILYRIIRKRAHGEDCLITLGDLVGLEDNHLFKSETAMRQAIKRINDYYASKYTTKVLFVSKRRDESDYTCRISYAPDDK